VPIVNHVPNITVTGIPSVPPKVRIAYPALNSGRQIIQVFVVTLSSTGGYSNLQNEAELELTVTPEASAAYAFFPQLIPVDGAAGSDGRRDTPAVLRYVVRTSQQLSENAIVLYSGLRSNEIVLGNSSLGAMFGTDCGVFNPMTSNYPKPCFVGDYRYGAFFEKEGTTLRYITPWSGEAAGKAGIHAIGATVDVVP
jgi:hypothetical protein